MPGLYLLALIVSIGGVALLDARFRLALWRTPVPVGTAIVIGTFFFVGWDAVGIASGVFVRGGSPLLLGIELFPHLPVEEPVFLAFLCYLALVVHAGAMRGRSHRRERREGRP